ncbi:heat stress transcription factor A-1b-like [Gastrolobium bilobum]|uniref:heat stress transcription factor A-1b-like n=1 Tax=Gastrolobium bilobum TaxID=150636 RepID=UPI002AB22EF8|nr:heat stress transcription factor A-1b-like [Gastrolobium bilobum]XP_061354594.1 heat stress transcription factor A-1b-like [Gastrolobium bilobum]
MEGGSWNCVNVTPFLSKTYDMVDEPSTNSVVSWGDNNNTFVVWNVPEFARDILPKHFKHNNFSSFVRQLNTYGFRKVDPDRWEFANEGFLRDKKQLLKSICRRKSTQGNGSQQSSQAHNSTVGACVEVGKFGLEEEVERLKRDKNVLMQELVRLSQQQQGTDNQMQSVGQRVQVMEQRQQHMMSFLAKAMQSPGFFAQFVEQQNESNRHIPGGNKKRRFNGQEEDSLATKNLHNSLDGRVVKYQTSTNEAAKALLHQILQINNSTTTESSIKNPDAFLIDDIPSPIALDSSSSTTQVSNVTLSNCMPNSISEVQSPPAVLTDCGKTAEFPVLNVHNCQDNVLDFCEVQGMETESSSVDLDLNFAGVDTGNMEEIDMISAVLDETYSVEAYHFSPDADEISKLPGINDEFWELYFRPSPLTGDTEEIKCSSLGCGLTENQGLPSEKENKQEKLDKIQNVNHLTQLIGLLASES